MDALRFYMKNNGIITDNPATITGVGDCYKWLSISRVRDRVTGAERLLVKLYDRYEDTEPYTTAFCSMLDLHRDLHKLRAFGFVAGRKDELRMVRTIERCYYEMECVIDEAARTLEKDLPELLKYVCGYLRDHAIEARTIGDHELYIIPVTDFRALINESEYSRYGYTNIRRKLRGLEYTHCSPDRYDYVVKDGNGETIKVIALYADELSDNMQELNEGRERGADK
jgi:hypothetical protein